MHEVTLDARDGRVISIEQDDEDDDDDDNDDAATTGNR